MIKIFTLPDQDSYPEVAQLFDADGHVGTSYRLSTPSGERLRDAQALASGALKQWQETHGMAPVGPDEVAVALWAHSAAVLSAHAAKRLFGKSPVYDSEMAEKFAAKGMLLAYVSLVAIGMQATRRGEWLGGAARFTGIESRRADLVREVAEHWLEIDVQKLTDPQLRDGVLADSFAANLAILGLELPASVTAVLPPAIESAIPLPDSEQALLGHWWAKSSPSLILSETAFPEAFDLNHVTLVAASPARAQYLRDALFAMRDITGRMRKADPSVELTDIMGYGPQYKLIFHLALELMPGDFSATCGESPAVARAVYMLTQRAIIGASGEGASITKHTK